MMSPGPCRFVVSLVLSACAFSLCTPVLATETAAMSDMPSRCGAGEAWDSGMAMCMPKPDAGESTTVLSGHYNAFGVFSSLQGPRGVDQFAAPNWFMLDAGRRVGARQFINVELMGTAELWTYPWHGYPELLQVGEERRDDSPYVDAQHPHSSPIMGLTLSDTISITDTRSLRLSFAPRGESTDGPVAYVHRASARNNPDAPLGHHVGQDVGHITSTVLAAALTAGQWIIEASAFNGAEPEPMHVNLPLGPLNSSALRLDYAASPDHRFMASVAQVDQSDPAYPGTSSATRLSASAYDKFVLGGRWHVDHSFIVGSIRRHPSGPVLTSFLDEVTAERGPSVLWGRFEVLQRLASELEIPGTPPGSPSDDKRWVSELTVGYTHWLRERGSFDFAIGTSVTADVVPSAWSAEYGSRVPLTARIIVQVRGAGRWRR